MTYGSENWKSGFQDFTESVQLALPWPTTPAMIVLATGLETEATWNTVSGSTVAGSPTLRTPYPLANTTSSL